jgi:hypothetical protein
MGGSIMSGLTLPDAAVVYIAAGAAIVLVVAVIVRARINRRPTAEELERRRRLLLNQIGKIADGTFLDLLDSSIEYSYRVRGLGYIARQDFSSMLDRVPAHLISVDGPVGVKYDPRNPANSIVLCEDWSGLRLISEPQKEPKKTPC